MPLASRSLSKSLYIHWPFCASKCPYCDFNSHVRDRIHEEEWRKGYIKEIHRYAALFPHISLHSIFFGGGTPSLMSVPLMASILESIKESFCVPDHAEITMEANPTSFEAEKFKAFQKAGINRLSLGVQALNDKDLKDLGRNHSAREAIEVVHCVKDIFSNFSFDLIYARRHDHTLDEWTEELQHALSFNAPHMSLYQLTIEPGTPFERQFKQGKRFIPKEDRASDFYTLTQEIMEAYHRPAYEVSNHALKGYECRHNLGYWRYEDYIGIGPGAHGRIIDELGVKYATVQKRTPERWLNHVLNDENSLNFEEKTLISPYEQAQEQLIMGLRLKEAFDLDTLALPWSHVICEKALNQLEMEGYVVRKNTFIEITHEGRLRLNGVIEHLFKEAYSQ